MSERQRRYRKKPLAVFEHGTRIYAPSAGERRYRVIATDVTDKRIFCKFTREDEARAKARELEAYLASAVPLGSRDDDPRTVRSLVVRYLEHLSGRSARYQERQEAILRCWALPQLGELAVADWTPAHSEAVLDTARARGLAPSTVQSIGSCLRSLVTFAHKSRWLPREIDPMWHVSYSLKPEFQGQRVGFIPRASLPNDECCEGLFAAMTELGADTWALAMRLKSRCGARWGELIALRPCDISFDPDRVIRIHRAVEQSANGRAIKTTKNQQKRESIFPASLAPDLAAHARRVADERGDAALLFPGRDDGFAERRGFQRLWVKAAQLAGWELRTPDSALWHPHHLRHVAACWMLFDVGLDPAIVCLMLGHANPAFTMSRYVGVRTGAAAGANALTESW